MVEETTPDAAIDVIMNSHYDGADAFGIQLECLERQYRTLEELKRIFSYCMGKPIYITSYGNMNSTGLTDEECMEYLMLGCKAGAALCDIPADIFDRQQYGLTFDEKAVQKQMAYAEQIHSMGAEVMFSAHTHAYLDEETILKYALEQKSRGTDIVKIVNEAHTQEQLEANINMIFRLKRELKGTQFLFLAGGKYNRPIRQLGPGLGVCMYLCVPFYKKGYSKDQPLLRAMKAVRDNLIFTED